MSDLAAALEWLDEVNGLCPEVVADAARRWLALTPEECRSCRVCKHGRYEMHTSSEWACGGPFSVLKPRPICPECHGSGMRYRPETVELIAKTIFLHDTFIDGPIEAEALATAVLDAINGQERK